MAIDIDKIKDEYEENNDNFETLPVGEYPCFVYELEGRQSSNDNPMINITLKVANGEYQNRQLWTNVTLIPKAWFKVEEFFEAVDYDIENLPSSVETPEEVVAHIKDGVLGSKVKAVVGHREYKGETQENVKKLKKPQGDFEVEVEDDEDVPF